MIAHDMESQALSTEHQTNNIFLTILAFCLIFIHIDYDEYLSRKHNPARFPSQTLFCLLFSWLSCGAT